MTLPQRKPARSSRPRTPMIPLRSRTAANKSVQTLTHADAADATCGSAGDGGAAGDGGCMTTGGGDGAGKAPTVSCRGLAFSRRGVWVTGCTSGGRGASGAAGTSGRIACSAPDSESGPSGVGGGSSSSSSSSGGGSGGASSSFGRAARPPASAAAARERRLHGQRRRRPALLPWRRGLERRGLGRRGRSGAAWSPAPPLGRHVSPGCAGEAPRSMSVKPA